MNRGMPGPRLWAVIAGRIGSRLTRRSSLRRAAPTATRRCRRCATPSPSRASCSASALSSGSLRGTASRAKKKTAHASEQSRPDVLSRREAWFKGQLDLDPDRLVFIDETWAKTNMARPYGRCLRGERLRVSVPHGHRKTTTFVGALTLRGFIAPFVIDGHINRNAFDTYVARVLVPELRGGDIVCMDNLPGHTGPKVRAMI